MLTVSIIQHALTELNHLNVNAFRAMKANYASMTLTNVCHHRVFMANAGKIRTKTALSDVFSCLTTPHRRQ
jgi:hypothetical protein